MDLEVARSLPVSIDALCSNINLDHVSTSLTSLSGEDSGLIRLKRQRQSPQSCLNTIEPTWPRLRNTTESASMPFTSSMASNFATLAKRGSVRSHEIRSSFLHLWHNLFEL